MSFKTLLQRSALAFVVCAVLVALSSLLVDKPVALFVHGQRLSRFELLKWMTYLPVLFDALAPVVLVLAAFLLARGPLTRFQTMAFAASVSILLTAALVYDLKVGFGRYWPETWVNDNPSLIRDDAYGFHPFHSGAAYGSFPSGHTARTLAVTSVVWIAYPRWRWLSGLVSAAVPIGLVGMNYHFVGDAIGGGVLGATVGAYTACFFRLHPIEQTSGPGD